MKDKQSSTILAAQLVPFIRMERKEFLEKALVLVQTTKFVDVISQPTKKAIISLVFKVIFELLSSRLEARWGKKRSKIEVCDQYLSVFLFVSKIKKVECLETGCLRWSMDKGKTY